MARVILPLLSQTASGQFAKSMVFTKNNVVRKYVIPANPQTVNQMTHRNTLGDIQRSLKLLGATLRAELAVGFGPRWNSMIVGDLMVNAKAQLIVYQNEFVAFTAQQKTDWDTADGSTPLELTAGVPLYACASAIYDIAARLGVTVTLTLPAAANSVTVGAEWTA